jgi:glucose/arabinose dehydrogenase
MSACTSSVSPPTQPLLASSSYESIVTLWSLAAPERPTPEERAAFLDEVCGADTALRRRVEVLLARHFEPDSFINEPGAGERPTILAQFIGTPASSAQSKIQNSKSRIENDLDWMVMKCLLQHFTRSIAIATAAIFCWQPVAGRPADPPYGLEARSPIQPFLNHRLPPDQPEAGKWLVAPAFPHLRFANPVGLVPEPASNRLCVHQREGIIYAFENDPDVREKEVFLDISARTQGWDDCGVLGMAFHPEFGSSDSPNRGYVYVFYQYRSNPIPGPERPPEKTPGYDRLSRFTVPVGARAANPDSELVLIEQYDRSVWHNGGAMFFHPDDGFLYLSLGDEGGVGNEFDNAQRIDWGLFSGVIRIDVNQDPAKSHPIRRQPFSQPSSRTANYYIPNDNPFLDPAGGVLEEFWCIGLRSPHRMTYDPITDTIWLGDVGQAAREEINLIVKGGNYQWAYREGNLNGPFPRPASLLGQEVPPLYEYGHTRGESHFDGDNCVIGGYVYRGREHAELEGKYIFGDNGSGRIWALTRAVAGSVNVEHIATMPPGFNYTGLSSFGIDHAGELYLCQMGPNGQIFKLARPEPAIAPPSYLSEIGAFTSLVTLEPAPGLIPFEINSPLWSDAALKTRWIALPNNGPPFSPAERVAFAPAGPWSFPNGTVFVKHFALAIDETDPDRMKRLETRFLVRDNRGAVYGLTYRWRPDHSDADLLPGALEEELAVKLAQPVPPFLSSLDLGGAGLTGSTSWNPTDSSYTLAAVRSEINGTAGPFHFAHHAQQGDFDIQARLELDEDLAGAALAGLMVRQSLEGTARHVFLSLASGGPFNADRVGFWYRSEAGGRSLQLETHPPLDVGPRAWLRLRRVGIEFTGYVSTDGRTWTQVASQAVALPETVQFGLALFPQTEAAALARFLDLANNRAQTWYYPSRRDCVTCHTAAAGHVLGARTAQLNGLFTYPSTGRTDNQLRVWNHLDLLEPPLDENQISALPRLVSVNEPDAPLERRVRSYLAANCASCHLPGGARANFDARYETPLSRQNLINGPLMKPLGIPGERVIVPGDLSRSVLFHRINLLGENQMPPLARNLIDTDAVAALAAWIDALPSAVAVRGLRGEYFVGPDLADLRLVRIDPAVDFDWGTGSPAVGLPPDGFSVRWSGEIEPLYSETYTFHTLSDDGVRLWIDGRLIIDNWTDHPPTEDHGSVTLSAGVSYPLRLEYYESAGGATIQLFWSSPSQSRQIIPSTRLSALADPVIPASSPWLRLIHSAGGQMRLVIDAEVAADYSVDASGDLRHWTELYRFFDRTGLFEFTDPLATDQPWRFYRVRGQP